MYQEKFKGDRKNRVYYDVRPMMAEETWANMKAFLPIYLGILVFMLIVGICYFVEASKTRKTFINIEDMPVIIVGIVICGMAGFYFYWMNRCERTMCLFRSKDICIKRYLRKDKIVTYGEVKECLEKRKLRVHDGNFEYPYKGGVIKIHTADGGMPEDFYKFMNNKCNWKVPNITKTEKDVVRRTGMGRLLCLYLGIPFLLFELFALLMAICDFGWDHSIAEIKDYLLCEIVIPQDNFWGIIAVFIFAIGILFKIIYYFIAKHYFRSWDGIKVTFF